METPSQVTDAALCHQNGWVDGPTVIEITAIGEDRILAKRISHHGQTVRELRGETTWTLQCRDWRVA